MAHKNWRHRIKKYLVECLGGKCCKCGYKEHYRVLEFHHIKNKKYSISFMIGQHHPLKTIFKEAKKCILLCSNCHTEYHLGVWTRTFKLFFDTKITRKLLRQKKILLVKKVCALCFNKFVVKKTNYQRRKFCSYRCTQIFQRKTKRPSKMKLKKEITLYSWCALGRKYKVSDNAIRKWARRYQLL